MCGCGWLQVEVLRFVHVVTVLALATGVAFYVIAVARGGNPLAMFISCFVVRAAPHDEDDDLALLLTIMS